MDFELGSAILAGFIAGAVMEGPVYLQKAMGRPIKQDIFRTWGEGLLGVKGAASRLAGFGFHQALAVAAGILYALLFDLVGAGDDLWMWGLIGGLVHYGLAGPVVALLPSRDPGSGRIGTQGWGYRNYGPRDVVTSLMGHLIFGISTGVLYGLIHSVGGSTLAF